MHVPRAGEALRVPRGLTPGGGRVHARVNTTPRRFLALVFLFAAAGLRAQTPITVEADATDAARKVIHAHLTIPVKPGTLALFYPKWLPGEHAPTGPINSLVNLRLSVGGKMLPWQRDPVELYTIRCVIPEGASTLDVTLDNVIPTGAGGYSSGTSTSAQLAILSWNQLLLYPSGTPADQLVFQASMKLPAGWKFGTALPVANTTGEHTAFAPVSLTTLVDSPVVSGAYYRNVPLTAPGVQPSCEIDIVADSAAALALPDEEIAHYKTLVAEATTLYGGTHYGHYHFLVALSEHIFHSGIEHHESSLNTLPERSFIDKDSRTAESDLLPHEYTHSWNGKYRRPASLTTPDFQVPMQDDLLWVYEGLTEYAGSFVLTARAGLRDATWSHDWLASSTAQMDNRAGRQWRTLQDTATAASLLYESSGAWANVRRGVDFYREGILLWLEVDTIIRQKTGGAKSLDDFTHVFHGGVTPAGVVTYTFDDVVNGLNAVAPYEWRSFLREHLDAYTTNAPLGGLRNAGWELVYTDEANKQDAQSEEDGKFTDVRYSLGFAVSEDGTVLDVFGGSVAEKAGVGPSMKLVAVNGRAWSGKGLKQALTEAKTAGSGPIELLFQNDDFYRTFRVDYHGGARYPHLRRLDGQPDLLESISQPHAPAAK